MSAPSRSQPPYRRSTRPHDGNLDSDTVVDDRQDATTPTLAPPSFATLSSGPPSRHGHQVSRNELQPQPSSLISRPNSNARDPVSTRPNRRAARTVDDLIEKRCWICYDDDDEDGESSHDISAVSGTVGVGEARWPESRSPPLQRPRRSQSLHETASPSTRKRKWVHPCKCTLVAHEECLLTWISTYQLTHPPPPGIPTSSAPVKCPQCATPYTIIQTSSSFLTLLYAVRARYDSLLAGVAIGGITLGTLSTMSLYGLLTARHYLGSAKWREFVTSPRMGPTRLLQLALVGPVLILSRTTWIDGVLPFLPLSLILSSMPSPGQPGYLEGLDELDWSYPPGPTLTLCLVPWWRLAWAWAWRHISHAIISRERRLLRIPPSSTTSVGGGRGVVAGEGVEHDDILVDVQFNFGIAPLAGADAGAVDEGMEALQGGAGNHNNNNPAAADAADRALNLSLPSLRRALRTCLGALLFPAAAAGAGAMLLLLARRSKVLQRWLGIRIVTLSAAAAAPGTDTYSEALNGVAKWMWTSALGVASWFFPPLSSSSTFLFSSLDSSGSSTATSRYGRSSTLVLGMGRSLQDPVWWRTALGGAAIVMVKDGILLAEKVMEMRKVGRRRVGGYAFADGLDVNAVSVEDDQPTGNDE